MTGHLDDAGLTPDESGIERYENGIVRLTLDGGPYLPWSRTIEEAFRDAWDGPRIHYLHTVEQLRFIAELLARDEWNGCQWAICPVCGRRLGLNYYSCSASEYGDDRGMRSPEWWDLGPNGGLWRLGDVRL